MYARSLLMLAVLLAGGTAHAGNCAISGILYDPVGAPLPNATIKFDSVRSQTVSDGTLIKTTTKTTQTNASGAVNQFNLPQGLIMQATICTVQGGCGAPFSIFVPYLPSTDIGTL